MQNDTPRLIEHAFPLKQASLTSVHEKNVRHGHISTLHIWPARRPLAACRAALIATLLPDPGTPEKRRELCERIGGKVVEKVERKKMPNGKVVERVKEEVEGGILSWIGTEPKSGSKKKKQEHRAEVEHREKELQWFRDEIRKAYGGRIPRVLDPFAGGGAIPLEAMRLGCEATAVDINPVAWFLLKCTLEYPQQLAGKTHPLPEFILDDEAFMADFYKAHPHLVGRTKKTKKQAEDEKSMLPGFVKPDSGRTPRADLAWHVRAWGRWVLNEARKELASFYPTYADFEPLNLKNPKPYEPQEMRLVPLKDDGTPDIDALNAEFSEEYLTDKRNPRWVAKPTVAYLWARTIRCKHCGHIVPILKTRWLCRKDRKRILLHVASTSEDGVQFELEHDVPVRGGNAAQKREQDKTLSAGTMTKSGAKCVNCPATMTKEDLQIEGCRGEIGLAMTAVIVDGQKTKEYRLPSRLERETARDAADAVPAMFDRLPGGIPDEPIQTNAKGDTWCVNYGIDSFAKLFTDRQLLCLGRFSAGIRSLHASLVELGIPDELRDAVCAHLYCCIARLADRNSQVCTWQVGSDKIGHTFARYALPFTWDFVEVMPWADSSGGYSQAVEWVAKVIEHTCQAGVNAAEPTADCSSAIRQTNQHVDLVITDPPYYDAIGYGVVMDFFAVWLKRALAGVIGGVTEALESLGGAKWNSDEQDGELVEDAERHGGDKVKATEAYEDGMARAFASSHSALESAGRMVVVFAHKHPDAWGTLVSAIIRAGFIVDGSWPIMTERTSRMRSMGSAALSSSLWIVCRKRPATARPGWDNRVLEDMRANITERLRDYWDAGIRGPDFVWAATGPALEAYSKHPVVKKANDPGQIMSVGEFLIHVRRMVVDFVVGEVLTGTGDGSDMAAADRMDSPTAYYLLHRHDFGLDEAPAGACILYATACGISDRDLEATWDLIATKGGSAPVTTNDDDDEESGDEDGDSDSGGTSSGGQMKLKSWLQRKGRNMGYDAPSGRPVPLIDRVHRLMHLWRAGDVHKVDDYLDDNGLRRHELFKRLVQSLIELSDRGSEERTLLESLSNHIGARGATAQKGEFMPDAKSWGREDDE